MPRLLNLSPPRYVFLTLRAVKSESFLDGRYDATPEVKA
jgi:hypothetical protein